MPLPEIMAGALSVKLRERGDQFSLCAIMNVRSGACSEDCGFCAQSSRYKTGASVYPFRSEEEILRQAVKAKEAGAARFSLVTSGRGLSGPEVAGIARRIEYVSQRLDIGICASCGILDREALAVLKEAGLTRYHHNIETSEAFFPKMCSTHTFADRMATIEAAREAGLEVCSGGIIGMGESFEDRLSMAETLVGAGVDSVPLNILVPIKGTPMESFPSVPVEEILRTISIFRLALPDKALRIAGGRDTALRDFQSLAFMAGADAMLIGGYLTVSGRPVERDRRLVEEMRSIWRSGLH